jgi:hypothetical protein
MNSNGLDEPIWRACSTCSGQHQEKTYYETSKEPRKQLKIEEF